MERAIEHDGPQHFGRPFASLAAMECTACVDHRMVPAYTITLRSNGAERTRFVGYGPNAQGCFQRDLQAILGSVVPVASDIVSGWVPRPVSCSQNAMRDHIVRSSSLSLTTRSWGSLALLIRYWSWSSLTGKQQILAHGPRRIRQSSAGAAASGVELRLCPGRKLNTLHAFENLGAPKQTGRLFVL
jgi:hypothetical protein